MTHDVQGHTHEADPPPRTNHPVRGSIWSDPIVDRLKHYAGSLSCKEIAFALSEEFGFRITRNAVIGKLARLGYTEPRRQHYHGANPELSEVASQREKAKRIRSPRPRKSKFTPRVIECTPRAVSLMDLEADECRYPVNEADEASGHLFCGLPTKDCSWCPQHAALVFVPRKVRNITIGRAA